MTITFLLPCYIWAPSGGAKVVYEYANRLVHRGHRVAVVHPRRVVHASSEQTTAYQRFRRTAIWLRECLSQPSLQWQSIDRRVEMLFVPSSDSAHIPDGDAIFATAWHTVESVVRYPLKKGIKCYLIQHYEVWQGPKILVDATWRSSLHKVVVAKWLRELGGELGSTDITYIPNAINDQCYRLTQAIEDRPRRIAMMFSREKFKGSADGIKALEIVKQQFPDLRAIFFGTSRGDRSIPGWIEYYRNPPQAFITDHIFGRSCIFLCPSLSEGWGLPGAEAAACGCALVSTDNGGAREYIRRGVTGLLSPPGDPQSLAANISLLLENESLRVQLARACNKVISGLSWDRSTDLLEDFIRQATSQVPSSAQPFPLAGIA